MRVLVVGVLVVLLIVAAAAFLSARTDDPATGRSRVAPSPEAPRGAADAYSLEGFDAGLLRITLYVLAVEQQRLADLRAAEAPSGDGSDPREPVYAPQGNAWDCIARLEVGGDWSMQGSTYSGIGFLNAAWQEWGGLEFAPNAGMATPEQQITIARRIVDAVGPGAWSTADECGLTVDS